jgi:four helix bundle protein
MAFKQAMEIYEISKSFPKEEKYSLTDQIRRSSRSVCANFGEGYRKQQYPAHFRSKLSDSDMENTETLVWIDFSRACGYINKETHTKLTQTSNKIGCFLGFMIRNLERFRKSLKFK